MIAYHVSPAPGGRWSVLRTHSSTNVYGYPEHHRTVVVCRYEDRDDALKEAERLQRTNDRRATA